MSALSDPDATRRAFALVSLFHPRLSYERWTRYLRRATRPKPTRAGVVFVEDPRGYPHALFRYAVDLEPSLPAVELGARRVLRLTDLVVGEIAGSGLLATIARHGEGLARQLKCGSIAIELPGALLGRAGELAGYDAIAGGVVCRSIEPTALDAIRLQCAQPASGVETG
ncbi:hypothetical protein IHQ68_11625 [Chelatococcus sambhunathii]|uniref:PAS domain n=1 Tax=Chelatococcus sambhunathii TaxID=363953 RepID=A0ABU1DGM1_9HYPH|nr:hypothetical protein [Chelatococcus sambhunathii]MDR4307268.1 hypothetical protein [Chelatococcus sambhunathii]